LRVVHILRKPPSEGSISANVLKHGCGAINVDACRIRISSNDPEFRLAGRTSCKNTIYGNISENVPLVIENQHPGSARHNSAGRWPANLVLEHLPGCRQTGKRKVRSGVAGAKGRGFQTEYVGGDHKEGTSLSATTFNGPDGMETTDAWECEAGCPVAELDRESGFLCSRGNKTSLGHGRGTGDGVTGWGRGRKDEPARPELNDGGGGASRFFKQVKP
jgi:hypothetical protein